MSEDTAKNFPFTVEGEPFTLPEEKVTANSIIKIAQEKGISAAQGKIENITLKGSKETIYSGNDLIDLLQDNEFTLGVKEEEKIYRFKVNGQELESKSEKLVVLDIIKLAQEKGVPIPPQPALEAVGGPQFKDDDCVDLGQFHEFLLISKASTPVA